MGRYATKRVTSAGGLVVDERDDGVWVLLIARRGPDGDLRWTLPKGRLEDGEDTEEAALREVAEETGLRCEIVDRLGVIDYWFVWPADRTRYHKYVHYYTMRSLGGSLDDRDEEADEIAWMPLPEAVDRLAFANERDIVAAFQGAGAPGTDGDERR